MKLPRYHLELPLTISAASDTVPINGRCTLKKEGVLRVVYVAGLPMYHWSDGDRTAEAHAMVILVRCRYADQNDVARAFGFSTRTLRRSTQRFEAGGMNSLGRGVGRPQGARGVPSVWASTAKSLKTQGLSVRDVAQKLGVSKSTAGRWTTEETVVAEDHRKVTDAARDYDPDPGISRGTASRTASWW